jgi:hypothetical protein
MKLLEFNNVKEWGNIQGNIEINLSASKSSAKHQILKYVFCNLQSIFDLEAMMMELTDGN